jgi:hypothetical protein
VVAAGVTTTGWALSTAAFHIINNPPILQKLRAELEAAIPSPNVKPSWTELERYHISLDACEKGYACPTG